MFEEGEEQSDYWLHMKSDDIGEEIAEKSREFDDINTQNGRYQLYGDLWRTYYGYSEADWYKLTQVGEHNEYVKYRPNHFRSIINTKVGLATQNKPAYETRAVNTDADTKSLATLSRNVIDFYTHEKRMDNKLEKAAKYASVLTAGYVFAEWDELAGSEYGDELIDGEAAPYGDVKISNPTPFDVVYDIFGADWYELDWVIVREWMPRHEVISRWGDILEQEEGQEPYPKIRERIGEAPNKHKTWTDSDIKNNPYVQTQTIGDGKLNDDIRILTMQARPTPALPYGRQVKCLADGTILEDAQNPYGKITLERMVEEEVLLTTIAHNAASSMMQGQSAADLLNSTIMSSHHTFSSPMIVADSGTQFGNPSSVGGYKVLFKPKGGQDPHVLNINALDPNIPKYVDRIVRDMELLSGISDISRGSSQNVGNLSGSSLALVASQTALNQTPFQTQYAELVGRTATNIIMILKNFANNPRTISVFGKNNNAITTFQAEDLADFDKVHVTLGNPITRTQEGRMAIADTLVNKGLISKPSDYMEFMATGNFDTLIEGEMNRVNLASHENELLMDGKTCMAHPTDDHQMHIAKHAELLQLHRIRYGESPEDLKRLENIQNHMLEHEQYLAGGQPGIRQEQPEGGFNYHTRQFEEGPSPGTKPDATENGLVEENNQGAQMAEQSGVRLPSMPTNPATGQAFDPRN